MKKHLLIIALQLAAAGADAYYTDRNARTPQFREHDWIARPFVTHGAVERGAYFAVYVGGAIAGAELFDHFGHKNLGSAIRSAQIYENTHGAFYSATH